MLFFFEVSTHRHRERNEDRLQQRTVELLTVLTFILDELLNLPPNVLAFDRAVTRQESRAVQLELGTRESRTTRTVPPCRSPGVGVALRASTTATRVTVCISDNSTKTIDLPAAVTVLERRARNHTTIS